MATRSDAIIIGAGIIGASLAYGLSQRGLKVRVIDRHPAVGYGSTSSSSAVVRTFYSVKESCQLAWEGLHCWENYRDFLGLGSGDFGSGDADNDKPLANYIETGCVLLRDLSGPGGGAPDGMDAACAHHDALNIPYEHWGPEKAAKQLTDCDLRRFGPPKTINDPAFGDASPADKSALSALYFPKGGYVDDPQLAARNLADAARRHGAEFCFNTGFAGLRQDRQGRVIGLKTDSGKVFDAPVVVNAAGPHASLINQATGVTAGMAVKTRPLRQEVAHVPVPENYNAAGYGAGGRGVMIGDPDNGIYLRPNGADHLLIGGMEPDCDPLVWLDDPDVWDRNLTDQWTAQVWRAALRYPGLGIPGQAQGVVDLYDAADDWTPIYDRSDIPGFYLACGTSGNQFKNGCIAGQILADLIVACEDGQDHDADPVQAELPYTGQVLNMAAFSRRRQSAGGRSVLG